MDKNKNLQALDDEALEDFMPRWLDSYLNWVTRFA